MKNRLLAMLRPYGQEHLLAFWDRLDAKERECLARQIEAIDFAQLQRLYEKRDRQEDVRRLAERAESPPAFRLDAAQNLFTPEQAKHCAQQALRAGRLGVVLVAGGQGTRLGFDQPKGMFPIGPLSGKSLFQIHAEKIIAAARRYGVRIPLYVMTSPATYRATKAFFAEHKRFGLAEEDFRIDGLCQGTMPAVDIQTGRVLLESHGRLALSPDGHGGMLAVLARGGVFDELKQRGIEHLFYLQVDNPLVDICGREFVGYHLLAKSELSTQVIAKRDPLERVGNVVQVDGRLRVIEYSDLPDDIATRRNPDGSLAIWAGSIAVHVMDVGFLQRLSVLHDALPFHIARKKVRCLDPAGNQFEPVEPNAIKFERFIFDLLPHAENAVVVEVDPATAFAPLKNAPGAKEDSPEIVRAKMMSLARRWLRSAGARIDDATPVEISPLWALDAEETAAKIKPGTIINRPTYFERI